MKITLENNIMYTQSDEILKEHMIFTTLLHTFIRVSNK